MPHAVPSTRAYDAITATNGSTYYSHPAQGVASTVASAGTAMPYSHDVGLCLRTGAGCAGTLSVQVSCGSDQAIADGSAIWMDYDRLYAAGSSTAATSLAIVASTDYPIGLECMMFGRVRLKFACTGTGTLTAEMTVKPRGQG